MGGARQAFIKQIDEVKRLSQEGDQARASAALDEALALLDATPGNDALHEAVIAPLWELGRLEEAAQHLETLVVHNLGVSTKLAAAYIRLGRLKDAVALLAPLELEAAQALALGTALRYRGHLEEARPQLSRAYELAKGKGDLAAAIAALTAAGELELDAENPKEAVMRFGQALGLTERSSDSSLTVLPLAGLAEAQAAWGYPAKGLELARRAQERLAGTRDRVASARVLLSLGCISNNAQMLLKAIAEADAAPHLPLALKASVALAREQPGLVKLPEASKLAERIGMDLELYRLRSISLRADPQAFGKRVSS